MLPSPWLTASDFGNFVFFFFEGPLFEAIILRSDEERDGKVSGAVVWLQGEGCSEVFLTSLGVCNQTQKHQENLAASRAE